MQSAESPSADQAGSGTNLFEVEKVLGASLDRNGKMWCLIKWKGYDDESNTWESKDAVKMASNALHQFYLEFG